MIKTLPVMLLKGFILLPNQEVKVELNNDLTRRVVMLSGKDFKSEVLVVSPKDNLEEIPDVTDLPNTAVIGVIKSKIELPNGHLRVKIYGKQRVHVKDYFNEPGDIDILKCHTEDISLPKIEESEEIALKRNLIRLLKKYIKNNPSVPNSILSMIKESQSIDYLSDMIANFLPLTFEKKIDYMTEINPLKRAENLLQALEVELEVIKIDQRISVSLQKGLEQNQKEFILHEKIKEIQKELGEENERNVEIVEWQEKLSHLLLEPKTVHKIEREIKKYEMMNEMSPDASFVRNYLDSFFSLPWNNYSQDITDLNAIMSSLNQSHYGLQEVKTRIIEYMAVKKRNPALRSPILCLVGPPGVGKTTIAMSIAKSLGKEFYKISVGGLNDASELSGHRRTYIGSSLGKIMEALMKCGTKNPLLLIDEVDKMTKDYKGDPASVLLDVLDYPQNQTFVDHYLEEPFDLSNVLFILTANDQNKIPIELRDRLEIIELSSYTIYEKIILVKDYLLPQIYAEYGLTNEELIMPDGIIKSIISHYTFEAGVRDLRRKLEAFARKVITANLKAHRKLSMTAEEKDLKKYLGTYLYEEELLPKTMAPGLVQGLAKTNLGGRVMPIETCLFDGTGKIIMTGSLKDVIKESISVAIDYIKSHQKELQVNDFYFQNKDIHLHAIDGATPKDGPSAGIAIVSSLLSLFYNQPIPKTVAMSGEITLRGEILAIGGMKEKLIGAFNAGIMTVYLPKENKKDLKNVPDYVKENMNIVFVGHYKELFKLLFHEHNAK